MVLPQIIMTLYYWKHHHVNLYVSLIHINRNVKRYKIVENKVDHTNTLITACWSISTPFKACELNELDCCKLIILRDFAKSNDINVSREDVNEE